MRTAMVMTLLIALGGCYSVRHRNDVDGATSASTAPVKASKKSAKQAKEVLPAGLGGDKTNHAYTSDTPQ